MQRLKRMNQSVSRTVTQSFSQSVSESVVSQSVYQSTNQLKNQSSGLFILANKAHGNNYVTKKMVEPCYFIPLHGTILARMFLAKFCNHAGVGSSSLLKCMFSI